MEHIAVAVATRFLRAVAALHELLHHIIVATNPGAIETASHAPPATAVVYPYARDPVPAAEMDRLARQYDVTVIGAGVTPGFIMDLLPLLLTAPCVNIRHMRVTRVIDATERRSIVQQRIGAGLTPSQFRQHVARGAVRHVGLPESMHMVANGLGWQLARVTETIDPIIAEEWVRTPYLTVAPGQVAGIRQTARAWMHGREVLNLVWQTAVGMRDTHDEVQIDATPPVDMIIRGGLHGPTRLRR